ncbi:uncharacterized protein P174DRAFT_17588 [Aspergillus novofumigatus IBT 16806]|uniref:Uncharacterized protein n=1 Tax=Aspergillus novofumigatus (strain IBT 16806) TaxID=1392255 RepID=A0A2I1CLD6_ASPN1|nr:uncharacterized protein P174DRAFT_17588 [Aspergillus novofumigatus IBT 16806]PKX98441.1 hypothetical protein P174DRAFT_17588 [Aspergillus novofumigatus IBT 16806]
MFRGYLWTTAGQRDPLVAPESLPRLFTRLAEVCTAMAWELPISSLAFQDTAGRELCSRLRPVTTEDSGSGDRWTSTCRCTFIDPECLSGLWFWLSSNAFPEMNHYWADWGVVVLSHVEGAAMVQSPPDSDKPDDKYHYFDFIIIDQRLWS